MLGLLFKRYWLIFTAIITVALFIGISYAIFTPEQLDAYSEEIQAIEILTAFFMLVASGLGLYVAIKTKVRSWYLYTYLTFIGALREVGAHAAFTEMSMLKSRFYISPEIPLYEKLIGLAIILSLAYAGYKTIRKFIPSLFQLLHGVNHVVAIYICLGYFAIAKVLDAFFRLFPSYKMYREDYGPYMRYAKESMEMAGAFFLMLAPIFFIKLYQGRKA